MSEDGVYRRLRRILPRRGVIILPVDGGLIDGPLGGLGDVAGFFGDQRLLSNIDAIIGFRGLLSACAELLDQTAFISNLSVSTCRSSHTYKRLVGSVESAVRAGADGVCFQFHLSDAMEGPMLRDLGIVADDAGRFGMPVMAIAYPRRHIAGGDDNYHDMRRDRPDEYTELVAHAVRVAVELGADLVKTVYTGSVETFSSVVKAACGVPVIVAGGPVSADAAAEARAVSALSAGAWGVAYGRQIFMHPDPLAMTLRLRKALDAAIVDAEQ